MKWDCHLISTRKEGKKKLSVICVEVMEEVYQEDRSVSHLTPKQRDDRYDLNQLRTQPWIPNQDEIRVIKISWLIVSKAAERSSRQRHDIFCDPIALMR